MHTCKYIKKWTGMSFSSFRIGGKEVIEADLKVTKYTLSIKFYLFKKYLKQIWPYGHIC